MVKHMDVIGLAAAMIFGTALLMLPAIAAVIQLSK